MPLETYRSKRDFARTPEPEPGPVGEGGGRFVVQRHRATSAALRPAAGDRWRTGQLGRSQGADAGPRRQRRLAMRTEDHPIEYFDFEGTIPRASTALAT